MKMMVLALVQPFKLDDVAVDLERIPHFTGRYGDGMILVQAAERSSRIADRREGGSAS